MCYRARQWVGEDENATEVGSMSPEQEDAARARSLERAENCLKTGLNRELRNVSRVNESTRSMLTHSRCLPDFVLDVTLAFQASTIVQHLESEERVLILDILQDSDWRICLLFLVFVGFSVPAYTYYTVVASE